MSIVEGIGFLISLLSLVYIFFKQQSVQENETEGDPLQAFMQAIEKEKERRFLAVRQDDNQAKSVLKGMHMVIESKKQLPQTGEYLHYSKLKAPPVHSSAKALTSRDEENAPKELSRAKQALKRLSRRRDLIIYQEVMDAPKGLRF